ncbi:MAG TPA: hypothetical protein VFW23_18180 [Tepidisphaeraceae bacterium]|nr:hypothetical protein [Tepidisphaeraceae bacterium]
MSRTAKLFKRLDELEEEFRRRAGAQLQRRLRGGFSMFLLRLHPQSTDIRIHGNDDDNELFWMEKEIIALRAKLQKPMDQSPVGQFHKLCADIGADQKGGLGHQFKLIGELLDCWGIE